MAIIGAGPAGLMAADMLCQAGVAVTIYDAMPSFGRKFLMAGKSGLNISHNEEPSVFLTRFIPQESRLIAAVQAFGASQIVDWMHALSIEVHTGSTGRLFPKQMKASPLLRAWLARLSAQGARFRTRSRWIGWDGQGQLKFATPDGLELCQPDATILGLGGASWSRLGSDGSWTRLLQARGVALTPFEPRNCGFQVDWSPYMRRVWAGSPVRTVTLTHKTEQRRGAFMITQSGVESGIIYPFSGALLKAIEQHGEAYLSLDLRPDVDLETLKHRLARPRAKQSFSNHLRKAAGLDGVRRALLLEHADRQTLQAAPEQLAQRIKALPLRLTAPMPLDTAISTAGGVAWEALDAGFGLKAVPGVFCAGEMIAWDAPTGGYLMTACLATGRAAAAGCLDYLSSAGTA